MGLQDQPQHGLDLLGPHRLGQDKERTFGPPMQLSQVVRIARNGRQGNVRPAACYGPDEADTILLGWHMDIAQDKGNRPILFQSGQALRRATHLDGTIARSRDVGLQEGTLQGIILDDEHGRRGSRPGKRAPAVLTGDQSLLLQVGQHMTYGQRRDSKPGRQLGMGRELRAGSELAAEQAVTQYHVDPARPWAESIDHRLPPNALLVCYSATSVVENHGRVRNSPLGLYRVA